MQAHGKTGRGVRLAGLAIGIAVAAAISVATASAGLTSGTDGTTSGPTTWEFSLQADGGTLQSAGGGEYDISLTGVDRKVLAFQDRPGRKQETVSVRRMARRISAMRDSGDPPNGVISAKVGKGQRMMGVELLGVKYKTGANRLDIRARRLQEERSTQRGIGVLPARFGSTSVFVDGFGHFCISAVDNFSNEQWFNFYESKWDSDDWSGTPPFNINPQGSSGSSVSWETDGGAFRGCSNTVGYQAPNGDQMTVYTPSPWSDNATPTCSITGSTYVCQNTKYTQYYSSGVSMVWAICYATNPACEN